MTRRNAFPKYWNFKIKLNRNSRAEWQTISQMKNALEIIGNRTELVSLKMKIRHDTSRRRKRNEILKNEAIQGEVTDSLKKGHFKVMSV